MIRAISVLLIMFISITNQSCLKKGCIDSTAANFDNEAKKTDGSCLYFVDLFAGDYEMNETQTLYYPGIPSYDSAVHYTLSIRRESDATIKISNIGNTGKYVIVEVYDEENAFDEQPLGLSTGDYINGVVSLRSNAITMGYDYYDQVFPYNIHGGAMGTKQN